MSITLNAGSGGATLGTDTVTGTPNTEYQIVKIGFSATGVAPVQASATNPLPVANYFSGTAASVNTGNADAGTLRVVLATNQPSLSNALPVSQSGTWTVNLGTLNGVALDASVNGLLVAQAAALGTNKGPLIQGSVTTAAPTYTTGTINPLSLTTAGALRIDGSGVTQPVSGTFWQATQPVSGTFWQATQPVSAASLPLPTGAATAAKQPALGTAGAASADVISVQGVASMTPLKVDGSGVTQPVSGTVQPGNTANTTPWLVTDTPGTSGGLSFSYTLSAASNNLTQAKGTAGQLFTVVVTNTNAAARYLKIFNKASASVTMGTTAADFQFVIPGNTAGAGLAINIDKGIAMGTGITYAITAGVSLTDNTSVATNEVSALIGYK